MVCFFAWETLCTSLIMYISSNKIVKESYVVFVSIIQLIALLYVICRASHLFTLWSEYLVTELFDQKILSGEM